VVGEGDRPPQISIRACQRRSPDIIRARFAQHLQATANIVRRILTVGVHSNDDLAPSRANGGIQSGGGDLSRLSITRRGRTIRLYKSKIWRVPSSLIPSAIRTSIFMSPKACRQRESRQLRMCLRSLRQATITDTRMFSLACMFGFYFPRDRELSEAIPALKESAWRHIPLAPAAKQVAEIVLWLAF